MQITLKISDLLLANQRPMDPGAPAQPGNYSAFDLLFTVAKPEGKGWLKIVQRLKDLRREIYRHIEQESPFQEARKALLEEHGSHIAKKGADGSEQSIYEFKEPKNEHAAAYNKAAEKLTTEDVELDIKPLTYRELDRMAIGQWLNAEKLDQLRHFIDFATFPADDDPEPEPKAEAKAE